MALNLPCSGIPVWFTGKTTTTSKHQKSVSYFVLSLQVSATFYIKTMFVLCKDTKSDLRLRSKINNRQIIITALTMNLSLSLSLSLSDSFSVPVYRSVYLSLCLSVSDSLSLYIYIEWTVSTCHCVHFSGVTITVHSRHPSDFANRWPELGTVTLYHPKKSARHGGYKAFIKGVHKGCVCIRWLRWWWWFQLRLWRWLK